MFRNAAETILGKKSNLIEELQELYYERKETCHNKLVVKRLWSDNIFLGRNRLNIKSPPPWPLSKQFHLFNPFLLYSALCTMGLNQFWGNMLIYQKSTFAFHIQLISFSESMLYFQSNICIMIILMECCPFGNYLPQFDGMKKGLWIATHNNFEPIMLTFRCYGKR